jgi:hypothetical protein
LRAGEQVDALSDEYARRERAWDMALTRQALNFDGTKPSFIDGKGHYGFGFRNKANFSPARLNWAEDPQDGRTARGSEQEAARGAKLECHLKSIC